MENFWVGLVVGVILGLIVGWLMGRRSPAADDSGAQAELQTTKAEIARLRSELSAAERDTVNWRTKYDEQVAASTVRPADMSGIDGDMDAEQPVTDTSMAATMMGSRPSSLRDAEGDLPEVVVDRPALRPVDDVTMDMPDISADMPAMGDVEAAGAPLDAVDTVVSGRVRAFDDAAEPLVADMPQESGRDGDMADAAAEAAAEVPRFGSRFAPADMPPVEVEPVEKLPDVAAHFLDDLPEGAMVVRCPQDLSAVRGIGQQYEQKLYRRGVGTYWMLAELSDEMLTDVLGVQAFQDVDLDAIRASAREWAEKTSAIGRVWDATEPDDFEVLDGIGDVYEGRLYDAGICTYEALAALTEAELAEICRAPSFRQPDYAGWIATAQRLTAQERA